MKLSSTIFPVSERVIPESFKKSWTVFHSFIDAGNALVDLYSHKEESISFSSFHIPLKSSSARESLETTPHFTSSIIFGFFIRVLSVSTFIPVPCETPNSNTFDPICHGAFTAHLATESSALIGAIMVFSIISKAFAVFVSLLAVAAHFAAFTPGTRVRIVSTGFSTIIFLNLSISVKFSLI